MIPHFTKRLQTEAGIFNFYFNRIYTIEGLHYHVSTIDKHRKAFIFQMEEIGGKWRIISSDACPSWIVNLEKKLEELVLQSMNEQE